MKTKFFTGAGDRGKSKIGKAERKKNDPVFDVLGGLDSVNSLLGVCAASAEADAKLKKDKIIQKGILSVQELLFIAQAEVASVGFRLPKTGKTIVGEKHIKAMENIIRSIDEKTPKLETFVIPGASIVSAYLDVARAESRRVERLAIGAFAGKRKISYDLLAFLNRLSSVLFALGRYANVVLKKKEKSPSYGLPGVKIKKQK